MIYMYMYMKKQFVSLHILKSGERVREKKKREVREKKREGEEGGGREREKSHLLGHEGVKCISTSSCEEITSWTSQFLRDGLEHPQSHTYRLLTLQQLHMCIYTFTLVLYKV